MSQEVNYEKAFNELQEIVQALEDGDVSVDALSEKIKRAAQLIKVCKAKLSDAQVDVQAILKDLENN